MKVLIAEDEPDMRKIIGLYLKQQGLETVAVGDGESAMRVLEDTACDLAVLDWMMPKMDGIQVCREIRRRNLPVKVVMLTARHTPEDEIAGLSSGADEYISKPFDPRILALRIGKLLRNGVVFSWQGLSLDADTGKVIKNSAEISLNRKEFELLAYFFRNVGIILSREVLLNAVWGVDYLGDDRTVDTHVLRLRRKIGCEFIHTHHGLGYSFGGER